MRSISKILLQFAQRVNCNKIEVVASVVERSPGGGFFGFNNI